jgi:hypothetical protein
MTFPMPLSQISVGTSWPRTILLPTSPGSQTPRQAAPRARRGGPTSTDPPIVKSRPNVAPHPTVAIALIDTTREIGAALARRGRESSQPPGCSPAREIEVTPLKGTGRPADPACSGPVARAEKRGRFLLSRPDLALRGGFAETSRNSVPVFAIPRHTDIRAPRVRRRRRQEWSCKRWHARPVVPGIAERGRGSNANSDNHLRRSFPGSPGVEIAQNLPTCATIVDARHRARVPARGPAPADSADPREAFQPDGLKGHAETEEANDGTEFSFAKRP